MKTKLPLFLKNCLVLLSAGALQISALAASADWLVPGSGFEPLAQVPPSVSTLCRLGDGRVLTVRGRDIVVSADGMKTFPTAIHAADAAKADPGLRIARVAVTGTGAWVAILRAPYTPSELKEFWDHRTRDYVPSLTGGQLFASRSDDGGRTWSPAVMISDPALTTGFPPRNIVVTANKTLLLLAQYRTPHPGRHTVAVLRSTDDGRTWRQLSPRFDLPNSNGNHDGLIEPQMIQLRDAAGTVWILFRTNLGSFWESRSTDDGLTWSKLVPTKIRASSSPGTLLRLSDNRLVLAWNPWNDSEGNVPPMFGGDDSSQRSLAVASWQRRELILATSRDEGATWSEPIVVARHPGKGRTSSNWISYISLWESEGWLNLHSDGGKSSDLNCRIPVQKLP